jgi:hypothetical protein
LPHQAQKEYPAKEQSHFKELHMVHIFFLMNVQYKFEVYIVSFEDINRDSSVKQN